MKQGLIFKKQADLFDVKLDGGEIVTCVARKVLKEQGLFVGDVVLVDDDGAIAKLQKRKNILIRPPVANIDRMFIVVAPLPKPDLYTVDKMFLFCALHNIEPLLCINKVDLDKNLCEEISKIYSPIARVLIFSSFDNSVEVLQDEIKGVCVLAGQSAVGKSSIINALKKESCQKVDTFSKKTERGKQTTRTVQLFEFSPNNFLADTAGFSKLDEKLLSLEENEIKNYYPEFLKPSASCKYKSCLHTTAKDCGVIAAVNSGKISQSRYQNYLKLHDVIKNLKKY